MERAYELIQQQHQGSYEKGVRCTTTAHPLPIEALKLWPHGATPSELGASPTYRNKSTVTRWKYPRQNVNDSTLIFPTRFFASLPIGAESESGKEKRNAGKASEGTWCLRY